MKITRWRRRIISVALAFVWIGVTAPAGISAFTHGEVRGIPNYNPMEGIFFITISIVGSTLIYLGGRVGCIVASVPLAIWSEELARSLVRQNTWAREWPFFIFAVVLSVPAVLAVVSWHQIGWLRDMPPNQALQHNDPSCHVSCLRTPRASRGRG